MRQTETEKITDFTINMVTVSTELKTHYPKLTDYEILKLSLDLQKNVILDNIFEQLDCLNDNLEVTNQCINKNNDYLREIVIGINNIDHSF